MASDLLGVDPRDVPAYSYADAARYLGMPRTTTAAWVRGTTYRALDGETRAFLPVIQRPDEELPLLSFTNLVELHVLSAIRRVHRVQLRKVREALEYVSGQFPIEHPLARLTLRTDGVDLYIEILDRVLSLSGRSGQLAIRDVVSAYLRRVERDEAGLEARFFPFTRASRPGSPLVEQPRVIVIDPRVSFGRPVVAGSGVTTAVLAERYKAGESVDGLARDYGVDRYMIEEAIRCEFPLVA